VGEALGTSVTGILRNKCERSCWDKCNWNTEKQVREKLLGQV
jgi:hypothetical protein